MDTHTPSGAEHAHTQPPDEGRVTRNATGIAWNEPTREEQTKAARDRIDAALRGEAPPPITTASVRVMRSHDYCHFEVVLGTDADELITLPGARQSLGTDQVDALRKTAARLVDKAIEQYKVAKANFAKCEADKNQREYQRQRAEKLRAIAETDRTPEQAAELKAHEDAVFHRMRRYDYEDEWEGEQDYGDED